MLLGFLEAGVAPTFIAVTQMWWWWWRRRRRRRRRREQPLRLGAWYASKIYHSVSLNQSLTCRQ
jgi:hypothetical protein